MNKVLMVCVVGLGLVGCVSQGQYDALMEENQKLQKENQALSKEKMALKGNVKLTRNQLDTTTQELVATSDALAVTATKAVVVTTLYDELVNELSSELANKSVTIEQMQSGVNVNLPEDVLFSSGSAAVKTNGQVVLHKVAGELKDVPFQTIVAGFTDNVPISKRLADQFPSNWDLAAARATEVVRLLEDSGVPGERLVSVSFGENNPVAPNDSAEGRAQNRRIEIRLRPVVVE